MKALASLLGCIVVLLLGVSTGSSAPTTAGKPIKVPTKAAVTTISIGAAKGSARIQMLDNIVAVNGFYLADPAPMLVQHADLTRANTIMRPDSYLLLSGPAPSGAQVGDEISVEGFLRQPGGKQPPRMQSQSSVLEMAAGAKAKVFRRAGIPRASTPSSPEITLDLSARVRAEGPALEPIENRGKYAVLISAGDSNSPQWRARYSRELRAMREMLRVRGYADDAIFTLSGGRAGRSEVLGNERAATLHAVRTLFDQLATVMTERRQLVVYATGCGGGFFDQQRYTDLPAGLYGGVLDEDGDEDHEWTLERICDLDLNGDGDKQDRFAYDEVLQLAGDEVLTDDELATNVAKITRYGRMVFLLQQSFSGGFARDLAGPNRVTITACSEKQWAFVESSGHAYSIFTQRLLERVNYLYAQTWLTPSQRCMTSIYLYLFSHDNARPRETPGYMAVSEGAPHYGGWESYRDPSIGVGLDTWL